MLERAAAPGPPRLLAQPRAARLLGLGRLHRRRVRRALRRRGRVPDAAPARAVRGRAGVSGPAPSEGPVDPGPPARGAAPVARQVGGATTVVLVRHGEAVCNVDGVVGGADRLHRADRRGPWPRCGRWPTGWPAPASCPGWRPSTPRCCLGRWPRPSCWPRPSTAGGSGPPLVVRSDCDLCELHPGEADGLTWPEFVARYEEPDWDADPSRPLAPGGESWRWLRRPGLGGGGPGGRPPPGRDRGGGLPRRGGRGDACCASCRSRPACVRLGLRTDHASLTVWERNDGAWLLRRYNDAPAPR